MIIMSMAAGEFRTGGFGPGGFDTEDEIGASGGVAGAMTLFVLIVGGIAMWVGVDAQRVLLTASLSMILFGLINFSPAAGMAATIFYQCVVGGLKRYMIPILGYSSYDPLLLVVPVVVLLFFVNRILRRNIPRDTTLSRLAWVFLIIMFLQMLNPLQGGLALGFAGGLFYICPFLWFYCGRSFGTVAVQETVLKTVLFVALIGAIYGLYQQFVGFTEVEKQWIAITRNDRALYLTDSIHRVFSFFSSFAEYVHFVSFGMIISFATMLRRNRMAVIPFVFFFVVLVLSSSRGALLGGMFALSIIWAVQGSTYRSWASRLVIAGVFGIAALAIGLTQAKQANFGGTTDALVEHQVKGIFAPIDKKASTGADHISLTAGGVMTGFRRPFGIGLGGTTIAGGKFQSSGEGFGAENDFGNIFISCGAIGGFLYVFLVGYVIWRAARRWHHERNYVSIVALTILASDNGFWLMGAHYAETVLIWFLIGCLDKYEYGEMIKGQMAKKNKPEGTEAVGTGREPRTLGSATV
jgi:hypothetical protein